MAEDSAQRRALEFTRNNHGERVKIHRVAVIQKPTKDEAGDTSSTGRNEAYPCEKQAQIVCLALVEQFNL